MAVAGNGQHSPHIRDRLAGVVARSLYKGGPQGAKKIHSGCGLSRSSIRLQPELEFRCAQRGSWTMSTQGTSWRRSAHWVSCRVYPLMDCVGGALVPH